MHPNGVHLAIAPAFFGFFAQFGAMQAWEEALSTSDFDVLQTQIKGLAGCSAGAMTAILIASGISPSVAAEFCRTVTLDKFADPPGIFAIFKGDLFHDIMDSFMKEQNPNATLLLQDSLIPVAVSSFDIRSMKMRILTKGSMPLAARSSACFPFLFEPVKWPGENENESLYLIDGGITDMWGFESLAAFQSEKPKRVIHIALGNYNGKHGPNSMPGEVSELITISIRNTPSCGPLSMPNGPKATTASRLAMLASMDLPLYRGRQAGHYVLHIDTTDFIPG
jgi:NTE family protein